MGSFCKADFAFSSTTSEKLRLDYEKNKIEQDKANEEAINKIALTAGGNGADATFVNNITKSKSVGEAIAKATAFLSDPMEKKIKSAQLAKIYADIDATKAKAAQDASPVPIAIGNMDAKGALMANTATLKLTEGQGKALAFAQRAIQADHALRERLKTYDPTTIFAAAGRLAETDNARAFKRDMDDFITAALRKQSGATITEDEFARFIPLFSPQGIMTNKNDVEQTNAKRNAEIDAIISEAGTAAPALNQFKKEFNAASDATSTATDDVLKEFDL
jgi:hypothetical protein